MPFVFAIVMLVLCSTCAIKVFTPPQTPQQIAAAKARQEEDDVRRVAKELVRQKAALGANAQFAPASEMKVTKTAEGSYEVAGYFQKADAGKARTNFNCLVKKNGYQWSLLRLDTPS